MKKEILFFEPINKTMIWGGECWTVSAHSKGDTQCINKTYEGKSLSKLFSEEPELFGNTDNAGFPLLVKIIEADADLSIQVHPDDEYARAYENEASGKTECWYILEAEENSTIVCGHKAATREELVSMIDAGRYRELINEIPVKKGDFVLIKPGTVHTIRGGVTLLEIQQSSDITYRVYDYDRLQDGKPRELHTKQAKEVISVPSPENLKFSTGDSAGETVLADCGCFRVSKAVSQSTLCLENRKSFRIVSCVEGEGSVEGNHFKKGQSFIVPAEFGDIRVSGNFELIITEPGEK